MKDLTRLTKTDCGEIEFQFHYYTELDCRVVAYNETTMDIVCSDADCLLYVVVLKVADDGFVISRIIGIHERTEDVNTYRIQRAIDCLNWLNVVVK